MVMVRESYDIELIDGNFYEGEYVTVKADNGKTYKRKVCYGNGDLYININGCKYFLTDIINYKYD